MSNIPIIQKIIVITAPSGAGKTSIARHLMQNFPQLSFSISATTRQPRSNEADGKDYYFISPSAFENKIGEGAFIEWEMVYEGMYYGTLKSELDKIWLTQKIPMLDIDVQGAMKIKKLFPHNSLTLFIAPPSIEVLRERLEKRGTETPASIEKRIKKATEELSYQRQFDHVILNADLHKACDEAAGIIETFLHVENEITIK